MKRFHLSPYSDWWYHTLPDPGSACTMRFDRTRKQGMGVSCEDGDAHCRPGADQLRRAAKKRRTARWRNELDSIGKMLHGREVCTRLPRSVQNRDAEAEPDWTPYAPPDRRAAIVAVIDDGIGFANEAFRNPDGSTRFDYVWLQGAARVEGAPGVRKTDLPFGRELERGEIDDLLVAYGAGGLVDEEALYCAAGLIDRRSEHVQSAAARASHGTGVFYRAAGGPAKDDGAPILMAVALPSQVTQDTTGVFLEYFVILAIERILQRVEWLRKQLGNPQPADCPVAINLSYSLTAGPMDGSTLVDRFVAAKKAALQDTGPQLMLVVPAGNHRLSRTHARLKCGKNRLSEPLTWRVLPDDRTPSFVEIWSEDFTRWKRFGRPSIRCQLTPPGGKPEVAPPNRFNESVDLHVVDGTPWARAYFSWHPRTYDPKERQGRERIVLALLPTVAEAPGQACVPAGDWTIRIWGKEGAEADLHVQRDDTALGYRLRGRQSYFVDGSYEVFDDAGRWEEEDDGKGLVTRKGTLNAMVSRSPIRMIGAYSELEVKALRYSGLGYTEKEVKAAFDRGRTKWPGPDTHRPAAASRVHEGVLVAGTLSGSRAIRNGTSFAAPADVRATVRAWDPRPKQRDVGKQEPNNGDFAPADADGEFAPGDDDGLERVINDGNPRAARGAGGHKPARELAPPKSESRVRQLMASTGIALAAVAIFRILRPGGAMALGVFVSLAILAAVFAAR
jgi:hypothetical protein